MTICIGYRRCDGGGRHDVGYAQEHLAAIEGDRAQARLIACLAQASIVDMDAAFAAVSAVVGAEAAAMMLLRRGLSALTRTVPPAALLSAAASAHEAEILRPGSFVVLVPHRVEPEGGPRAAAVRQFWYEVGARSGPAEDSQH